MTSNDRRQLLEQAGNNFLNLQAGDVPLDYFSDVTDRVLIPEVANTTATAIGSDVRAPDLAAEFATLCPGSLTFLTKGRAAENALVDALALASPVVLTHGLFSTTMQALARCNAKVEVLDVQRAGSADLDLDALAARMTRDKVDVVYLEATNNGLGGWPLSAANLTGVRELCDRHGARLILDAARSLANAATWDGDVLANGAKLLGLAHAYTISCAKEYLFPYGAIVGSADAELVGKVAAHAFRHGTAVGPHEPAALRVGLAAGVRYLRMHPALLAERKQAVVALAECLRARGLHVNEPVGEHAVYVEMPSAIVTASADMNARFSLAAHLYVTAGMRGHLFPFAGGVMKLRLAVPLGRSIDARATAEAMQAFLATAGDAQRLEFVPGQHAIAPMFRRMRRRDAA